MRHSSPPRRQPRAVAAGVVGAAVRHPRHPQARSESPQGVIAFAAPLIETELAELIKRRPGRAPFLVAVDGVTDPGNLGAMLRCCDGAGVDALLPVFPIAMALVTV